MIIYPVTIKVSGGSIVVLGRLRFVFPPHTYQPCQSELSRGEDKFAEREWLYGGVDR